jgi:hypothetical protein
MDVLAFMIQQLGGKMDSMQTRVDNELKNLTTKIEDNKKDADARIAALEKAIAGGPPSGSKTAASSFAAAASSAPSTALPAVRGPSQGLPPPVAGGGPKAKIIVSGFKREVPRAGLVKHWEPMQAKCPTALTCGTGPRAGTGKGYSVEFPSSQSASAFLKHLREHKIDTMWKGALEKDAIEITFRTEKTPEEQRIGKIFAPIYADIRAKTMASEHWQPSYRFYLDARRGILRVETEDVVWSLFRLVEEGAHRRFDYDQETLRHFGLHPKMVAAALVEDATA